MLVPYLNGLESVKEDIMNDITDMEREKITEFYSRRNLGFEQLYDINRAFQPSLVLDDFLFLGNFENAKNREILDQFDIKHILNVCDLDSNQIIQDNYNVVHISMSDDSNTNIKQHFDLTNKLLRDIYEKNQRCLVHCAAGISRSATIVLAYLMKYHHNTFLEACNYLLEKRPQICPNEGFLVQLIRYENELIKSREIKPNEENKLNIKEENPIATIKEFEIKHQND